MNPQQAYRARKRMQALAQKQKQKDRDEKATQRTQSRASRVQVGAVRQVLLRGDPLDACGPAQSAPGKREKCSKIFTGAGAPAMSGNQTTGSVPTVLLVIVSVGMHTTPGAMRAGVPAKLGKQCLGRLVMQMRSPVRRKHQMLSDGHSPRMLALTLLQRLVISGWIQLQGLNIFARLQSKVLTSRRPWLKESATNCMSGSSATAFCKGSRRIGLSSSHRASCRSGLLGW